CSKCGKAINGTYYDKGNGKYLCEKDYKASLPRCCKCGQIISGKYYENENGTYLCEKDYIASCPVCSVCGKKAIGKYTVTGYGHFIACSDCMARKAPKCFLCSLPVIKNGVKYSDGRYACKYHCNDAITTQKQLKPYLRRAWKLIGAYVSPRLKTIPEYLTVHIVDETSLKNAHNKDRDELSMIFGMTHTFPRGDTVMFQIWILQGLPPNELDSTMVHECGHVWLRMHAEGLKGDTPREEGFCEWLSYKVNLGLGREDLAKQIDSRRDKLYGEGFQMYKKIEQKSGINGVLRYALHGK
ncbi:protein DA1, partial [bacterium]|nr:protein DA1 [bacterium]